MKNLILAFIFISNSNTVVSAFNSQAQTFSYGAQAPWAQQLETLVIKGKNTPSEQRKKAEHLIKSHKKKDNECAQALDSEQQQSCAQELKAIENQIAAIVAQYEPNTEIILTPEANKLVESGYGDAFKLEAMLKASDNEYKLKNDTRNNLQATNELPNNNHNNKTKLPAGSSLADLGRPGIWGRSHVPNTENRTQAPSRSDSTNNSSESFLDKIKRSIESLKFSGIRALTIQVWAQAPFGTLGQTGQSQLRTITANRAVEDFNREAKTTNLNRDQRTTLNNDILGQGSSALQERVENQLKTMNEITKLQDQSLQAIQHICQNQRASVPCWESGNEIPFDLIAALMNAGGGSQKPEELDLTPYTAWLHCPEPSKSFTLNSPGKSLTALFLQQKTRQLLTVKSKLPTTLHQEGCIVALPSLEDWQYFSAQLEPEILDKENKVEADLALLKIKAVHTQNGEDLANPETVFKDFVTDYWPEFQSQCAEQTPLTIGSKIKLHGFEPIKKEERVAEVTILNGLTVFNDEYNKAHFTTNGEENFNGGIVSDENKGCFKGLASITVNKQEKSNKQKLIPTQVIVPWLKSQKLTLATQKTDKER